VHGFIRQPFMTVALGDLARQHGADGAVDVADRRLDGDLLATLERGLREFDQAVVERLAKTVVLCLAMVLFDLRRNLRQVEDSRDVETLGLPVFDALAPLSSRSARPIRSTTRRTPSFAISSRASLSDEEHVVTTCSGLPSNLRRNAGSASPRRPDRC